MSLKSLPRLLIYAFMVTVIAWLFYWTFLHDFLVWHKDIYQIIQDEAYNMFYLFVSTLVLFGVFIIDVNLSHTQRSPSRRRRKKATLKPKAETKPEVKPPKKLHPFVSVAKRMVEKNEVLDK